MYSLKQNREEKAWFTYAYTQLPETKDGIELLLNYSFEELGLEQLKPDQKHVIT